jgi:hypothetical protein
MVDGNLALKDFDPLASYRLTTGVQAVNYTQVFDIGGTQLERFG